MDKLKLCPHCNGRIIERIAGGVHFYECQNPECRACTSFVGEKPVGIVYGKKMFEAENPRERFNRRPQVEKIHKPLTNFDCITQNEDVLIAFILNKIVSDCDECPIRDFAYDICKNPTCEENFKHWLNGNCKSNPNWDCKNALINWLNQPEQAHNPHEKG